jgi:hypothetical protein
MAQELIISSDSHVFEPPDLWTKRIEAAFRERAPRLQRVGDVDHLVFFEPTTTGWPGSSPSLGPVVEAHGQGLGEED